MTPTAATINAKRSTINILSHLLGVAKHRQAVADLALLFSVVHQVFLSQKTPTVNHLRQF